MSQAAIQHDEEDRQRLEWETSDEGMIAAHITSIFAAIYYLRQRKDKISAKDLSEIKLIHFGVESLLKEIS